MYILIAILAFGLLIFVHELGHFAVAKACGVKVTEFSMGMGPKLLSKQGRETVYSLRALPIGGFCAMEGEDESSDDPRAFSNQSVIKRILILMVGSFMNFLLGFILILILYIPSGGFVVSAHGTGADALRKAAKQVDSFLSVELSMGQMIEDIRLAVECQVPVEYYGRLGGIIPEPEEVVAKIKTMIR